MIISRTPFRISFLGGGSDFPGFFKNHTGCTLSTTIDKYAYISVHYRSPFFKLKLWASYARTETVNHASEFRHPLIRECLLHLPIEHGLGINHSSDLPGRTGLGTSSSFTVGFLNVLHSIRNESISAEDLAREAIFIERERVGDAGGHQDQYAAAYGGFLRINYQAAKTIVSHVALSSKRLSEFKQYLLLFYMGTERSSNAILLKQQKRIKINDPALKQMAAMAAMGQEILENNGDLMPFGELLHEAWQLKRSLAEGISNHTVDRIYEAALAAGALGGKLLGAGSCGFILLFVPLKKQTAVRRNLRPLQEVPFEFSSEGSRIIFKDQ